MAPAPARSADEHPVFFKDPDPVTAEEIRHGLDLLHKIEFSNHTTGREILEGIGYWAVEPCIRALREGSPPEKRNAALVLGTILDRRGLKPVLNASRMERQHFTPVFAALMIGKFRNTDSIPTLKELVARKDKEPRRVAALLSLTKIGAGTSGIGDCLDILLDTARPREQSLVRQTALFGLGFFRVGVTREQEERRAEILKRALRDPDHHIRRSALITVALLGRRESKTSFERAAQSIREGDPDIRRIALLALSRYPDTDVTKILLDTLERKNPGAVKLMVAFLLKDRKDPMALDQLKRFVRARIEQDLKAALILALSNFEDPETVDIVTGNSGLGHMKDQVKAAAAIACTRFEKPESKKRCVAAITHILKQGAMDSEVREDLELARQIILTGKGNRPFNYLGNKDFAEDLTKDVEQKLLDLVNAETERVLGITSLMPLKASGVGIRPLRVDDENSELRDLQAYLEPHPYFVPEDIPEPKLAITPREPDPAVKEGQPK